MDSLSEGNRPDPPYEFDIWTIGSAVDSVRSEVMTINGFLSRLPDMAFEDRVTALADIVVRHRENDQTLTILEAAMQHPVDPGFVAELKENWSYDAEVCHRLPVWNEAAEQAYTDGDYLTLFPILGYMAKHVIRADVAAGGIRLVHERLARAYASAVMAAIETGMFGVFPEGGIYE